MKVLSSFSFPYPGGLTVPSQSMKRWIQKWYFPAHPVLNCSGASFLNHLPMDLRVLARSASASWVSLKKFASGFVSSRRSKSVKGHGLFASFHMQVRSCQGWLVNARKVKCLRNWPLAGQNCWIQNQTSFCCLQNGIACGVSLLHLLFTVFPFWPSNPRPKTWTSTQPLFIFIPWIQFLIKFTNTILLGQKFAQMSMINHCNYLI